MAKFSFVKGSTSLILTVFILDSSATDGSGLGSLTEASGIVGGYVRMGETGIALAVDEDVTTEGTYQAPSTAAQVRIGTPANMRTGTYELHFHNDLFASGADTVTVTLGGASNMAELPLEIQLTSFDLNSAGVNVSEWDGSAVATPSIAGVPEVDVTHISGNAGAANSLKSLTDMIVTSGTAQGPGANSNQIQLAAGEPSISDIFDPSMILLTSGAGAGQSRRILEYDGSTKIAVVNRTWKTVPDNTTKYSVFADPGGMHVNEGLAQAGSASTITLNVLASAANDAYNGQTIFLVSGTGEDQARIVTAYNGTSKVATVNKAWDTTPDTTTAYLMLPLLDCANIERIGGSTQSATDLKDFADTGYDPNTNKVQGVVLVDTTTDVTNPVTTDATSRTESKATGFSTHDAAAVITALLASVGWTEGGTMQLDELIKKCAAIQGGDTTKATNALPFKDFEDGATTVVTLTADETAGTRVKS